MNATRPYSLTEIERISRDWSGIPIYLITLTYSSLLLPVAQETSDRDLSEYLRALRLACDAMDIPLRYVSGTYRKMSGYEVAHYIVLPETIPPGTFTKPWLKGMVRFERVAGIKAALQYMNRRPGSIKRRQSPRAPRSSWEA